MSGEPQLQQGSTDSDWIIYLQDYLKQYGYDPGESDGVFADKTEAAVRLYQENNFDAYGRQLKVDGIVGPKTWSSLTQATEIEGEAAPSDSQSGSGSGSGSSTPGGTSGTDTDGGQQSGESYTYDTTVNLVMQSTTHTCWAASSAMLLDTSEDDVVSRVGDAGGDGADEPEMNRIASELGLNMPGGQCMGPDGWYQMLSNRGPVMVGIPGHYIVITGISSDSTIEGTQLHVYDPARGEFWAPYADVENAYEIDADSGANLLTR